MKEKYPKYLPLGSVVMLENATKKLMITGFYVMPGNGNGKQYDYCGCLYPEGMISSNKTAIFNHDQIKKIFAIGYSDEEEKEFKEKMKKIISIKEKTGDN